MFSKIRIILVNTSHPGNIGAAARAMKTMGLTRLYLVNPENFPHGAATARASGADDVLAAAKVCGSLAEAIEDCHLVIGTSARLRTIEWPQLGPRECVEKLVHEQTSGEVALVFGQERIGLTNEEMDHCHYLMCIPANPEYSSLNLAAAVQIMCYEMRMFNLESEVSSAKTDLPDDDVLATADEVAGFHNHLIELMQQVRFIRPEKQKISLVRRLKRLFNRARLSQNEVNMLRGILSAVQKYRPEDPDPS